MKTYIGNEKAVCTVASDNRVNGDFVGYTGDLI